MANEVVTTAKGGKCSPANKRWQIKARARWTLEESTVGAVFFSKKQPGRPWNFCATAEKTLG